MKRAGVYLAVFFLALGIHSIVQTHQFKAAATIDPTFLVFRFQELQSLGEVEGALALLTEDAVVSGRGLCPATAPCVGKTAIRPEIARAAAAATQSSVVSISVSPNKVETRQETTAANIRAAGVERIILLVTFEFRDDKISAVRVAQDRSDPQTVAFADFQGRQTAAPAASQPATSPISPPSTGDGGLASD